MRTAGPKGKIKPKGNSEVTVNAHCLTTDECVIANPTTAQPYLGKTTALTLKGGENARPTSTERLHQGGPAACKNLVSGGGK